MKSIWMNPFKKVVKSIPYEQLAPIYDRLMVHVDYAAWIDYIESIIVKVNSQVHRIIDGGCGTGTILSLLRDRGYHVIGFDLSFPMVQMSRIGGNRNVWQGDLTHFKLKGKWDLFLCLYDTINYLNIEEVHSLFSCIRDVLRERGLFIFDTVTECFVMDYWSDYIEKDVIESWEYLRRSWYDKRNHSQYTEFKILDCHTKQIFYEEHVQWIHRLDQIRSVAEDHGFHIIGQFEDQSFRHGDETSDRVHFVMSLEW